MIRNLVSINPKQLLKHISPEEYRTYCGLFTSPKHGKPIQAALDLGAVWAADNDCFVDYNPDRILRWLKRNQHLADTCKFFNCPDVLIDAAGTLERFEQWEPIIKGLGWPIAFTVQNGMSDYRIPWERIDALFIGSTDNWKYSPYMMGVINEANKRGLWVHNGRVNSPDKIIVSRDMGCDSFDGSSYSKVPYYVRQHIPYHIEQPRLKGF